MLLRLLTLALLATACADDGAGRAGASETDAAVDASGDAVITAGTVYDHEADWPNALKLVRAWTPPEGGAPIPENTRGVVVRVNPDGHPRVDFGRHGKHEVPVDATDLVERANRVRAGTERKNRPNFLRQVGNRTVHPTAEPMRALRSPEIVGKAAYVCLFADPTRDGFPAIAERLAAATADRDAMVILFPESLGRDDVPVVRDRLAEIGWPVAFMYPHLVDDYRQALLGDDGADAFVLVVTAHGRVLYRSGVDENLDEVALEKALAEDRTVS